MHFSQEKVVATQFDEEYTVKVFFQSILLNTVSGAFHET